MLHSQNSCSKSVSRMKNLHVLHEYCFLPYTIISGTRFCPHKQNCGLFLYRENLFFNFPWRFLWSISGFMANVLRCTFKCLIWCWCSIKFSCNSTTCNILLCWRFSYIEMYRFIEKTGIHFYYSNTKNRSLWSRLSFCIFGLFQRS